MKKFIIFILLVVSSYASYTQSCDKKSCGPEGTKKEEAAVITTMRDNLQTVLTKLSQSPLAFDNQFLALTIEKGASDDESLLYISLAATSIRYELLNKLESSQLIGPLKEYKPLAASSKQQLVANLKKEIQLLTTQTEKL